MAEPQNYMQQVNAQQMARRKQRQRYSSNVVNPVESQGMMDRLQGSDVGSFSGGGDDGGIVPLNMLAGGGTPATTASYGGGTPATEAGWGDRFMPKIFDNGGNSDGNCVGGQCGTTRPMPTAIAPGVPYPARDNYPARKSADHAQIHSGTSVDPRARPYHRLEALARGYNNAKLTSADEIGDLNFANSKVAFADAHAATEAAKNALNQDTALKYNGTVQGKIDTVHKAQKQLALGGLTVSHYAEEMTNHALDEQPRVGAMGSGEALSLQGKDRVKELARHTAEGNQIVLLSLYHNGQYKPGMTPEESEKWTKARTDLVLSLAAMPAGTTDKAWRENVDGNLTTLAEQTYFALESRGIDPEDTKAMDAAFASASRQADDLRELVLAAGNQSPSQTNAQWLWSKLPESPFGFMDFRPPAQKPDETKAPLTPNSPETWGGVN